MDRNTQADSISQIPTELNQKRIFLLWVPLAAMWVFMAIEQPGINAVIARLANAKLNLAAYGVTLSISLIIESPIIQMLSAATALTDGRTNYRKLLRFMHFMAAGLTAVHLILALTPLYTLLLRQVLGIPEEIIGLAQSSFLIMIPWAGTIGYRRLYQGILIRYGRTKEISYTMFIRLAVTMSTLFLGHAFTDLAGANLGAVALIAGVTAGMSAAYMFSRPVLRSLEDEAPEKRFSWHYLLTFYYPLLLTSVITFLARPILNYGIARAALPLESLAVWPVVLSVMFLFRSLALSFQEVAVALLKEAGHVAPLRRFARRLSLGTGLLFFLFVFAPTGRLWFKHVAGLEADLLSLTYIPALIVTLVPVLGAFLSWYRGLLIYSGKTKYIARAVFLNTATLTAMVILLPKVVGLSGVVIAALAFTLSQFFEIAYLVYRARRLNLG